MGQCNASWSWRALSTCRGTVTPCGHEEQQELLSAVKPGVVENSELGIPHQHTGQREWGCRRHWLVCLTSNVCIVFTTVWTQQRGNAAQETVNQGLKMSELCLPCWACQGFLPGWFLMGRLSLGLCSSLEPDTPPAGVRLNLATAGNHVALLGSLGLGFYFLGGK